MAGTANQKRKNDGRLAPPSKKQKRQDKKQAAPASRDDGEQSFDAVNLLDSDDDDILNANVDDGAVSDDDDDDDDASVSSDDERPAPKKKTTKPAAPPAAAAAKKKKSRDAPAGTDSDSDSEDESSGGEDGDGDGGAPQRTKSKRNDPSAFATSMSKILATKLTTAKRADPVLARSAEAHESARAAVDLALEAKARKQLRQQKKEAMERGRVRNVLVAQPAAAEGEGAPGTTTTTTTADMVETERRLRKVAQRGVVKLFNAVRAAQVKAVEAEKKARRDGVVGVARREEKINEMSKKGFLDLIASGGGGLKKGALEEA
ncbi:Rrp15p-domain-containing protein [Colletotrichum falcatum]|nr:Rrp15p-domain-containing protein [Colletotrichum falcatum]